jgi:hypothetical protein
METIPVNRPMPWCSCTTRAPGSKSAYDTSFFLTLSFFGRGRAAPPVRRTGRSLSEAAASVRIANFMPGYSSPEERDPEQI